MSSISFPLSAHSPSIHNTASASGETKIIGQRFKDRIITKLSIWDHKLDAILPNFFFQKKLDEIGKLIQQKFEPLQKFNQWLDSNGHGAWYQRLATFLVKLPMRSVRNIVQLLYLIIKELLYSVVHPLKAVTNAAKLLTELVFELTRPECWSKIGGSLLGASLGQAAITGLPISVIGLAIGGAMIVSGV